MTHEIIHFPGPVMTFGMVARQRCAWCGALITEIDMANVGIDEASRPPERRGSPITTDDFPWWDGMVAVTGTNPVSFASVPDDGTGKAPERSCMMLMPAELEESHESS